MFTHNLGWTLFIFGIFACGRSVVIAMKGCSMSKNGSASGSSQDPLRIPRLTPRLFLSSYLSFTISYLLQSIDRKLGPNVKLGEMLMVWLITLGLLGLPIYSAQVRMMFRYSFGSGRGCSSPRMNKYECGSENEGEENLEVGVIQEEMRRDIRCMSIGHFDRKD